MTSIEKTGAGLWVLGFIVGLGAGVLLGMRAGQISG